MPGIFGIISKNILNPDYTDKLTAMAYPLVFTAEQDTELFRNSWYNAGTVGYDKSFSFLKKAFVFKDDVLLIMDGEVYPDAEDIPQELAATAPTIQRAEYCLYLYLRYGPKFVEHLNGAFVIAVFDNRDHTVHLYNDRFGSEPIYIWTSTEEFAFSTSQRSLLNYRDDIGRKYDEDALCELILFDRILGEKTLFQDIRRLVPASHAIWEDKKLRIERYWDIEVNTKAKRFKNEKDATVELYTKLKYSVNKRTSDNAPSAALLSGGVDSRILLGLCPQSTMAVTFTNRNHPPSMDTRSAIKIAKLLGHKHLLLDRDTEHYTNVAELAVDVNESQRVFTHSHSLGLHQQMLDAGIRVILTAHWWDTLFKGYYSIENLNEYICNAYHVYHNEPKILKARRIAQCVYNSLIFQKPHNHDLLMLMLNSQMKQKAALVRERVLNELFMVLRKNKENVDCFDYVLLLDLQSLATVGIQHGLRTVFPDRSPAYDNDLFSLALNIPISWKKGGKIVQNTLKLVNPKLAWITNANTGLPIGLHPLCRSILLGLREKTRDAVRFLSRFSKFTSGSRQPERECIIFLENSSWHDMNGLLRFSQKYRSTIERTVNHLDETFFDKKIIIELLNNDLSINSPRLNKLWEIILTFGLFDQKYGPNANRNTFTGRIDNLKIMDLTPKA
jgi:asparagine synthetase B (glutamine-hydrolysing)